MTPAISAAQAIPVVPTELVPGQVTVVPSAMAELPVHVATTTPAIYPAKSVSFCDCDFDQGSITLEARLMSVNVATTAASPAQVLSVEPHVLTVPRTSCTYRYTLFSASSLGLWFSCIH